MKRYLLGSMVLSVSLFGASSADVTNYLKSKVPPNVKVKVLSIKKLDKAPKFDVVSVSLSDGTKSQTLKLFTQGDFMFPDIIDIKHNTSFMQDLEKQEQAKKLKKVYKNEKSANIISLGNDPKKPTMVVFTDPECPYCRQELKNINKRLQSNNIKMILTPVHGKGALEKSFLIYKHIKSAKTDAQKIKLLNKYYDKNVDISKEKVTPNDIKKMEKLRDRYIGDIVKGVPYFINESSIK